MTRRRILARFAPLGFLAALAACAGTVTAPRPFPQAQAPQGQASQTPPPQSQAQGGQPEITPAPTPGAVTAETLPSQQSASLPPTDVPPPRADVVRVGLVLPLTGQHARLGRDMLDAAQLAMFEIGDDKLVLMPRDDEGTAEGAKRAVSAAIEGGAKIVLGPLLSTSVEAALPVARQAGVNLIAFSNDRTVAGNGAYIMGILPNAQVERVVSYAFERGSRRFAALLPKNPFGEQVAEELRRSVQRLGGQVKQVRFYEHNEDLRGVIRQLADYDKRKAALQAKKAELAKKDDAASKAELKQLEQRDTIGPPDFDALLLPEGAERLFSIAPLLPYFDINPAEVHILGTSLWEGSGALSEPALAGAWYASPPAAARTAFEQRFREAYGREPARLASLAYDAAALAAVLARQPGGADFGPKRLTASNGYAGVDGVFRFLPSGLAERSLSILEVRREGPKEVSPAPGMFQ